MANEADQAADSGDHSKDFTVKREAGKPPVRTDNRGILHMLHDEIGKTLGIGQAKDRTVNSGDGQQGLMDAVDEAVTGAKGAHPDY